MDEAVATTVHEPEFEVAVTWKQVLVGRSAAFEIGVPEQWKLHALAVQSGNRDIERPKILCWFSADEDDAMRGEKRLNKNDEILCP